MFSTNKILTQIVGHRSMFRTILQRYLTTIYKKELTVSPFCNVNIKLPFSVKIASLNVYKYQNADKVIVKLLSKNADSNVDLQCDYDKDTVCIACDSKKPMEDITCTIEAPVKANINIEAEHGDIHLSNFNGESITLASESGNISATKCHCDKISIHSNSGNIICKNVIQAANIHLKTSKRGSISTGKLQGIVLTAETENGDIQTESSYCNDSCFTTATGCLDLRSAHKNCKVAITNKGILNMVGFDGNLQADIKEGDAVIQIARLENDSNIKMEGKGTLLLKLFGTCLDYAKFKVNANSVQIDDNISIKASNENGCTILNAIEQAKTEVMIDCQKSDVFVQGASLLELFNLKVPKNLE